MWKYVLKVAVDFFKWIWKTVVVSIFKWLFVKDGFKTVRIPNEIKEMADNLVEEIPDITNKEYMGVSLSWRTWGILLFKRKEIHNYALVTKRCRHDSIIPMDWETQRPHLLPIIDRDDCINRVYDAFKISDLELVECRYVEQYTSNVDYLYIRIASSSSGTLI